MILTGDEIHKQVALNRIHIVPFSENNLNPNSYNFRLHPDLLEIADFPIDPKKQTECSKIELREEGYTLLPGHLYLGSTLEELGSDFFVPTLMGRSSLGRLGLFLQITADLGQIGAKHCWTLELKVVQPLVVYPFMEIGQISFWKVEGNTAFHYNGKYASDFSAHQSEIYQEFEEIS